MNLDTFVKSFDYIDRNKAKKDFNLWFGGVSHAVIANKILDEIPTADVVSKDLYNQAVWERDVAIGQLAEIGKSLGEKMDDVAPVKNGTWNADETCSCCGKKTTEGLVAEKWNYWFPDFCPHCGAKMCEGNGDINERL